MRITQPLIKNQSNILLLNQYYFVVANEMKPSSSSSSGISSVLGSSRIRSDVDSISKTSEK
jgi:hypothetical protein